MRTPISFRKTIPFFIKKTEADFRKDIYEDYDGMVRRQTALHLADDLWGHYPMQAILEFAKADYPTDKEANILEIGCGIGRWIAEIAQSYPDANCWGVDYSYQMLKRANEFWVQGKPISIDLRDKGFNTISEVNGYQLSNVQFGLASALDLPFENASQDLIISSFLLDRIDKPIELIDETYRVLKPGGKLSLVSPINFQQAQHWKALYPPEKLFSLLTAKGYQVLTWNEDMLIEEPLDMHNNAVKWNCLAFVALKSE